MISYLPNMSLLEALPFLRKCIVIQLILLYAGLSFINQAFFLAHQPFGTPSLINAFHQITITGGVGTLKIIIWLLKFMGRGKVGKCC